MKNYSENYYEDNVIDKNEEAFQTYIESLELTPEDFNKKILDIGAGNGEFAKWAKDHNVSSDIYSLDLQGKSEEQENFVNANAEEIPFKDNSFDLTISNCAIPNVVDVENIEKTLLEAIRVTKPGGEIRLSRVLEGELYEPQIARKRETDLVFKKLEDRKIEIEKIRQPHGDIYEYNKNIKTDKILAKAYLIKIKKPNNN
jgi:ubiquinone/menaquinone biosynthesis C-methylase UbiE